MEQGVMRAGCMPEACARQNGRRLMQRKARSPAARIAYSIN